MRVWLNRLAKITPVAFLAFLLMVASATTAHAASASATLTAQYASSYSSNVLLKWTKTEGYTSGYWVKRATSASGPWTTVSALSASSLSSLSWTDKSVDPGKTYYYKVQPYNSNGSGGNHSNTVQHITSASLSAKSASSAEPSVQLKWTKTEGYTSGYWVKRATSASGPWTTVLARSTATNSSLSWTDKSVDPGKTYYYKVQPYNSNSSGGPHSIVVSCKTANPPAKQGTWKKDSAGWWYQRADGTWPASRWEKIDGKWYYFNGSGYMATGWVYTGDTWRYLGSDGAMKTGWVWDGAWYYLDPANDGIMRTGWLKLGDDWRYLSSSGALQYGWLSYGGSWYYLDPANDGAMVAKKWMRFMSDDGRTYNWYYFAESGAMATDWICEDGLWYYFYDSGKKASDTWVYDGGSWYYVDDAMVTGWLYTGGSWYYLDPANDGAMATGWLKWDGEWYYLDDSGRMVTGWLSWGGSWFYLYSSGKMAHGCWVGDWYLLDDGRMASVSFVENDYVKMRLPEAWMGKVDVVYDDDPYDFRDHGFINIVQKSTGLTLMHFEIAKQSDRIEGGDIGYGLIFERNISNGLRVEARYKNWIYLLYDYMHNPSYYSDLKGLSEQQRSELLALSSGGFFTMEELKGCSYMELITYGSPNYCLRFADEVVVTNITVK